MREKTPLPQDAEAPQHDGFRDSTIVWWISECRQRLQRVTAGPEQHRTILLAEARMRQALDHGDPLDRTLGRVMEFYRQHERQPLPEAILARIDRQVAVGTEVREMLAMWADQDRLLGPCRLDNAACSRISRLELLVSRGWLPPIPAHVQAAIHAERALKAPRKAG